MAELREFFISLWAVDSIRLTLDALFKLSLAAVFSGIIGYEREHSHRPAGFRTHILVSVGSALVMITSAYIFEMYKLEANIDPARLGAQVISGIGFLGAGTILREGFSVKGLTTAASLWAVSCVGLAVGSGFYEGALVATIVIYITLNLLKKFVIKSSTGKNIYIEIDDISTLAPEVGETIRKFGANLHSLEILYADGENRTLGKKRESVILKALVFTKNDGILDMVIESLRELDGVRDLYVD